LIIPSCRCAIDTRVDGWKEIEKENPLFRKVAIETPTFDDVFEDENAKSILDKSLENESNNDEDLEIDDKEDIKSEIKPKKEDLKSNNLGYNVNGNKIEIELKENERFDYITICGMKFKQFKDITFKEDAKIVDFQTKRHKIHFYGIDTLDYIKETSSYKTTF